MGVQVFTRGFKPSQWPVTMDTVAPAWRWFYERPPIWWLPLWEGGGSQVISQGPVPFVGTFESAPTWIVTPEGRAVRSVAADSSGIKFGGNGTTIDDFLSDYPFTMAWRGRVPNVSSEHALIEYSVAADNNTYIALSYHLTNGYEWQLRNNGSDTGVNFLRLKSFSVIDTKFHDTFVVSKSTSDHTVYVDGTRRVVDTSGVPTGWPVQGGNRMDTLGVGRHFHSTGLLGDVESVGAFIWDWPLSSSQVAQMHDDWNGWLRPDFRVVAKAPAVAVGLTPRSYPRGVMRGVMRGAA